MRAARCISHWNDCVCAEILRIHSRHGAILLSPGVEKPPQRFLSSMHVLRLPAPLTPPLPTPPPSYPPPPPPPAFPPP
ncbi:hypothetical protein EQ822_25575, partial [Escherichia coli]